VRGRHGRAIAGLSQGGFGAFSYAARHPDLFSSAASFSGAPDIAWHPLAKTVGPVVVAGILSGLNGVQPYAAFGDPVLDAIIWEGHNPANLVENLRRTDLHLWTADGLPGELDEGPPDVASTGIEGITHLSTGFFAQAADQAGVDYTLTDYGQGTHTFAYWRRDLEEYLVPLMAGFARGPQRTGPVSYRAIEPRWEQWGWRVVNDRTAPAWSALEEAGPRGFVLTGASAAVVRTPRVHVPGRTYRVSSDSPRVSSGPVRANARGRLSIAVEAGSGTDPVRVTIAP
jgi:pimeloyl-ACP methyl ester carboxylesterase